MGTQADSSMASMQALISALIVTVMDQATPTRRKVAMIA